MAAKLTLLIFSRNDVGDALSLAGQLHGVADETVIVDSSGRKAHDALLRSAKKLGRTKVLYVVPLGYPDPVRMYALKKCSSDWILLMDTDERLSDAGVGKIRSLIDGTEASAFSIRRYENVKGRSMGSIATWQVRLFRKSKTTFRGVVHEQPEISGITERAGNDIYIAHRAETKYTPPEYAKMDIFGRMSYGQAKVKLMDYMNKAMSPRRGRIDDTAFGKAAGLLLKSYQKIKLRSDETELSDLDYLLFYFVVEVGQSLGSNATANLKYVLTSNRKEHIEKLRKWKESPDPKEIFEISKIIGRMGITRYLKLDEEGTIKKLNRRYGGSEGGIDLLIRLLKLRYEKGKRWLD